MKLPLCRFLVAAGVTLCVLGHQGKAAPSRRSHKVTSRLQVPVKPAAKTGAKAPTTSPTSKVSGVAHAGVAQGASSLPPLFRALTPFDDGFGPVICEPAAQNADDTTAAFGAGCGRWLQMVVGGQGELGRTPSWSDIAKARWEMRWPNLRLDANQAQDLARATGATHVAIGHIEGGTANCTLTYQLLAMPGGKSLGDPFVQTGSEEEVVRALPELARQISLRLGVKQPHIPPLSEAMPDDMAAIGRCPWAWQDEIPFAYEDQRKLLALSLRNPLAGMIAFYNANATPEAVQRLVAQAGDNVIVMSAAAEQARINMAPFSDKVADLQRQYPHNYQLALTRGRVYGSTYSAVVERKLGETAVRAARQNPQAWLTLGAILASQADAVRRARMPGAMSEAEQQKAFGLYPYQEAAVREAARLDPQNSTAWHNLSEAAAFNGDEVLADYGIQKALKLRPDNTDSYWWGLEVYQPKWYENDDKFLKVAELAAAQNDRFQTLASTLLLKLQENPLDNPRAQTLVFRSFARLLPATDVFSATGKDPATVAPPAATLFHSPGIVVCEPVVGANDEATASFGAGCSRWLQFALGGQTELGQTPLWHAVDEARRRLKYPDLRLTLAQSTALTPLLNVSHVAVGNISGNDEHCTLTYQLYEVPTGEQSYLEPIPSHPAQVVFHPTKPKPVGELLVLTGSKQQVLEALPNAARQLAGRLGVTQPQLPATVGASPQDLTTLGQVPWLIRKPLADFQARLLRELATRLPVAALIELGQAVPATKDTSLWNSSGLPVADPTLLHQLVSDLIAKAGDNPLVWGQIAWLAPREITPSHGQLEDALQKSPHNFGLAMSEGWWLRSQYNFKDATAVTWQAVRCNSRYGSAWLEFSRLFGDSAEQLREGAPTALMTPSLRTLTARLYDLQLQAAVMALRFDPHNSHATSQESRAAAFDNNMEEANESLWNAIELDPDNVDAYAWGLQLLQPKWGGAPEALPKLLAKIGGRDDLFAILAPGIIEAIQSKPEVAAQMQDVMARARAAFTNPVFLDKQDAEVQQTVALAASDQKPDLAKKAYQDWVNLSPDDVEAHYHFGGFLQNHQDVEGAIAQYREALRLNPNHPQSLSYLAGLLVFLKRPEEAEPLLRRSLQIEPDRALSHLDLARALIAQNKGEELQSQLEAAIRYDQVRTEDGPTAKEARRLLGML